HHYPHLPLNRFCLLAGDFDMRLYRSLPPSRLNEHTRDVHGIRGQQLDRLPDPSEAETLLPGLMTMRNLRKFYAVYDSVRHALPSRQTQQALAERPGRVHHADHQVVPDSQPRVLCYVHLE